MAVNEKSQRRCPFVKVKSPLGWHPRTLQWMYQVLSFTLRKRRKKSWFYPTDLLKDGANLSESRFTYTDRSSSDFHGVCDWEWFQEAALNEITLGLPYPECAFDWQNLPVCTTV